LTKPRYALPLSIGEIASCDRRRSPGKRAGTPRSFHRPIAATGNPRKEGAMPRSAVTAFLLLVSCISAFSQQPTRAGAPANDGVPTGTLRQIIPGHYVYSSSTYNSGIIVTNDGVVVLDALNTEAVARAQREALANTIKQPVRVLVSSTFHDNYSKGNVAYAD